ncbi:MAG: hypothetical protein Q9164_003945 [Protoblastenia rupestris]
MNVKKFARLVTAQSPNFECDDNKPLGLQEQPVDEKEKEDDLHLESATSSRRHSPVPVVAEYNTTTVINQQPQPRSPPSLPTFNFDKDHPAYRDSRRLSKHSSWLREAPDLASRACTKARRISSTSTSRPRGSRQVSEPTDFRRISASPVPRLPAFRPIQLSIYIPGNELPKLPKFSDDPEDDDDLPPVPEIPRPAQAVMRSRSDTLLTRSPSNFSIPRKPLASRQSSMDGIRQSIDSGRTLNDPVLRPRTSSLYYARSRRPSVATNATSRSNQEFLDMLNAPLPPLPQLQTLRPASSPPEYASSIFRRASDQSKRLQTHLQERDQVDARSPDCSTIAEERSPVSPRSPSATSPVFQQAQLMSASVHQPMSNPEPQGLAIISETIPIHSILKTSHFSQHEDSFSINPRPVTITSVSAMTSAPRDTPDQESAPRSSSGSSTLLNLTAAATPDTTCIEPFRTTTTTTTITHMQAIEGKTSVGQRLSQWLMGPKFLSKESLRSPLDIAPVKEEDRSDSQTSVHNWFDVRESMDFNEEKNMDIQKLTPKEIGEGLRRRSETVSTFVTERGLSLDIEKFSVPDVRAVGVAM